MKVVCEKSNQNCPETCKHKHEHDRYVVCNGTRCTLKRYEFIKKNKSCDRCERKEDCTQYQNAYNAETGKYNIVNLEKDHDQCKYLRIGFLQFCKCIEV